MRSNTRRYVLRLGTALPLGLFLAGIGAGAAQGADGVIVDETTVTAARDGDTITAKVKLTNLGPQSITLPETQEIKAGCWARITNRDLELLQATTVSIQLEGSCFSPESPILRLDLDGSQNLVPPITVKSPATQPTDWAPAAAGVPWGIGLAVLVLIVGLIAKLKADEDIRDGANDRDQKYHDVIDAVEARIPIADHALGWRAELPELKYPWLGGSVRNLEAGWSLTGSFVSNLTLGGTALVALVTSVDAATAILGAEPKAAFRVMATVGLVSALLIAIANLIVKALGPSASAVTPFGLIVATSIVVGAATLQTITVGASAARLVAPPAGAVATSGGLPQGLAQWIASAATGLVVAALGLYGSTAVWRWISDGKPTNVPTIPPDALTAWSGNLPWQETLLKRDLRRVFKAWLVVIGGGAPPPEAPSSVESRTRAAAQKLRVGNGQMVQSALL